MLVSRTKEKLIAVTNEIGKSSDWISLSSPFTDLSLNFHTESEHKVKTKWIAVDFAKGREVYEQIEKELAGIEVGILGEFF